MATGPVGEQHGLLFFDSVFHVASHCVNFVVKFFGWMIQIGHYESCVETLLQSLGLDDHAPLFAPGLCRVTRLVKQANFHIGRLILCNEEGSHFISDVAEEDRLVSVPRQF